MRRYARRARRTAPVRAVVFDIGGVLEFTPALGVTDKWERRLGLPSGELNRLAGDVWRGGSVGTFTEDGVHRALGERLGIDQVIVASLMNDVWTEYLGTLNTELCSYARALRPRYRTGILSNSLVGCREREQSRYGFEQLVDDLVYSHEVGIAKPDPRIYRLSCERLGVSPEETVFVDDNPACVEAAGALGFHTVHFRDTAQTIAAIDGRLAAG
ncbi:HAD family phosphatase [Streptomyces bohaiensis]|uniref:HAD family phosphatase n=1 Tax=Streptomyces bohaiensis TaxID=1431344 RepID=A0ABX1CJ20_9ACTN|nr:HAD family phosphatase [Streptomyces bohaiensis]